MREELLEVEDQLLRELTGKFVNITDPKRRREMLVSGIKTIRPQSDSHDLDEIINDINDLGKVSELVEDENIEDIMINNTSSVFVYNAKEGTKKVDDIRFANKDVLTRFVNKLKLYATNQAANGKIMDVHMPTGSRANIIFSPLGYDVTIRNFRSNPFSILDLINAGEMDYRIAARMWLYTDGFKVRPANVVIGGVPAAGKTTMLNSFFSFFRPEARIVTIEETYELNTATQENTVRLETSQDLPMVELVKNALRMRPDMIIIGEVRGAEANDMLAAMNVGKIAMTTIHASSTRDIINRLEHAPMDVPRDILPAIDALIIVAYAYHNGVPTRRIVQMSEISGIETQILLSDMYRFDYRTHQAAPILPSVTYRDTVSRLLGVSPSDILAEEAVRERILFQLNRLGKRDMKSISEMVQAYYDNPEKLLKDIGLTNISPAVTV
jgi:flagellar protein FlaI